jgi:molybdopterin molybdotransferase
MGKMNYQKEGISVAEAISFIKQHLSFNKQEQTERIPLMEGLGRVTATEYIAPISQPPFDRSAVDGYAICSQDVLLAAKDAPVILKVLEEVDAGDDPAYEIKPGYACRIMTGAPIPQGADAVVRQEDTDYGEDEVAIFADVLPHENYCFAGEDFKAGTCLIPEASYLSAIELGMLASMGYADVLVYQMPRIVLLTTGSELTKPGALLEPGKIYNANLFVLWGRFKELGITPVAVEMLPDKVEEVVQKLRQLLTKADLVITTGGVSVGKKDIMHEVFTRLNAKKVFWHVLVKPGTPTAFAVADGVPIVALSGNPFGALCNLEILIRPILYAMSGNEKMILIRKAAVMQGSFPKQSLGLRYIRGIYEDGKVRQPQGLQSSGVLGSMRGCNCLIEIKPGTPMLKQGDHVEVLLL